MNFSLRLRMKAFSAKRLPDVFLESILHWLPHAPFVSDKDHRLHLVMLKNSGKLIASNKHVISRNVRVEGSTDLISVA